MLDSKARRYIQPFFNYTARCFEKLGMTPKQVTVLALIIGILSAVSLYYQQQGLAFSLLWISGFLDVVDGSLARLTKKSSEFGALMDLIFDRIVEISFILSVCLTNPAARLSAVILLSSIIFSFSVFLTVGAVSDKKSEKAFYYQAGLAERTETFIIFSLIILFPALQITLFNIFAIMIIFTGTQRFWEAYKLFGQD